MGFSDAHGVQQALTAGFEPTALVEVGGSRLAVWVQHAPAPDPVRPFLHRAALLSYGQVSETAGRAYGPLAGFTSGLLPTDLRSAEGKTYSRAASLASELTAARAERLAELGSRLQAAGVPNLATFAAITPNPRTADLDWGRLALARGLGQPDILSILATQGRHRNATPKVQLAYGARVLSEALGRPQEASLVQVLQVASSVAAVQLKLLQAAVQAVRFVERLLR